LFSLTFELNRVEVFCDFWVRFSENFSNLNMVNKSSEKCYNISSNDETKPMNENKKFSDWDKYIYTTLMCLNLFAYVCNPKNSLLI
jgi:hypothetical protein